MKGRALIALACFSVILMFGCNDDSVTTIPVQPPTITSVSPNRVSRGEAGIATIQGTNFTGASLVFLGNEVAIQSYSIVSSATIEVHYKVNPNAAPGKRPVQVVTPAGNAFVPDLLEVLSNRAPITRFTVAPETGAPNTTYRFDAIQTTDEDGTIVKYEWEFGDGKKATGPVVSHKYGKTGTFEVALTVTDNDGAKGVGTTSLEVKDGVAPTAKFSINPQAGDVNTTYNFNGSPSSDSDGQIVEYLWNFGNGKTATGVTAMMEFGQSGTFIVTLTTTDNDGLQNAMQKSVTVGSFDEVAAAQEIREVTTEFFRRFEQLPTLSAEAIVVNWSDSEGCPGRAREIGIIEKQQQFIVKEDVTIIGEIAVTFNSSKKAHSIATAQFDWEETDGSVHTGQASHDFTFIFEEGKWQICDFVLF